MVVPILISLPSIAEQALALHKNTKSEKEMGSTEADSLLAGQAKVWQLLFGYVDSMALKCAVELGIADIINSHGGPITLYQIASGIDSPCVDIAYLDRIMRFLVCKGIFTAHHRSSREETLYGINHHSRWLLRDSDPSLAKMVILDNHPSLLAPCHYLSQCVKEGGIPFKKVHGCEVWDFASQNPEFNKMFNEAMASSGKIMLRAFISTYNEGFQRIGSLVDVGGGIGENLAEIVKAFPHIKGINFDLPHVVATAPTFEGVSHVSGNMFESIPNADAVFMKWILHDWGDESCVKILQNCRKAIAKKTGKLILMEIVLQPNENNQFGDMGLVFDLVMLTHTNGGKQRTEPEWKILLEGGGFPRYKIINIPALPSIIEAYPE